MRPLDKLSDWRLQSEQLSFSIGIQKMSVKTLWRAGNWPGERRDY
jgi:hypothetical protein